MNRLKREELEEIRDMLEKGLNLISNLDRIDRMKMCKRIRAEIEILGEVDYPSTEGTLSRFDEKLSDVMKQLPYGHLEDLRKLIAVKTARFRSLGQMRRARA
jgi:hypothetical protein